CDGLCAISGLPSSTVRTRTVLVGTIPMHIGIDKVKHSEFFCGLRNPRGTADLVPWVGAGRPRGRGNLVVSSNPSGRMPFDDAAILPGAAVGARTAGSGRSKNEGTRYVTGSSDVRARLRAAILQGEYAPKQRLIEA